MSYYIVGFGDDGHLTHKRKLEQEVEPALIDGEHIVTQELFDKHETLCLIKGIVRSKPIDKDEWDEKSSTWIINKDKQVKMTQAKLAEAKRDALAASVEYADNLQAAILGDASPAAQARLAGKYDAAVAIKSGTASAGDHAVIDAEVNLRPKYTKAQLVDVIIKKGTMAKQAEGMINGMLLLAQDAIEAATSLTDLDTAVKAITAKADAFKAQLLAGLQEG